MITKQKQSAIGLPKRAYKTPKLKELGNVKKLTLKTGSNVDGFGGTFV